MIEERPRAIDDDRILIKIIPPRGYDVYRLGISRVGLIAVVVAVALGVLGALALHAWQLHLAEQQVAALQRQSAIQRAHLRAIDRQADALLAQLEALQKQNAAIRRLLGQNGILPKARLGRVRPAAHGAIAKRAVSHGLTTLTAMKAEQARLAGLTAFSRLTGRDQLALALLASHLVNLRHLQEQERVRMIAALPSIWPVVGPISSPFGWRNDPWPEFHQGVDIAVASGTPVQAAADGTVVWAGWQGGFGIKVELDDGNGYQTWYAHLSRTAVTVGEQVAKGQTIAYSGETGEATGPHLHYQVMFHGQPIDPAPFLNGVPAGVLASLPNPGGVR